MRVDMELRPVRPIAKAAADRLYEQSRHLKHGETWPQYIVRIAELVAGEKLPPVKDMPEVRLPYRESP